MPRLQQNRVAVVVEKVLLAFCEFSHVNDVVRRYPHGNGLALKYDRSTSQLVLTGASQQDRRGAVDFLESGIAGVCVLTPK